MEILTLYKIPLGRWCEEFFNFLILYFQWFFDFLTVTLEASIQGVTTALLWLPDWFLILFFAALAYLIRRSPLLSIYTLLSLALIVNIGYWDETMQTLAQVFIATAICMIVGVPIGIWAAHSSPHVFKFMRPVLDIMQTIPTFVYLIPTLVLFGLGVVPGVIATVIFAIPSPIRLTYLGISSVPAHLLEVAQAFGATKKQVLWKIELPAAMPVIMAGLTQCIMLSLSMVVIAGLVGAEGLGREVVRALNTVNISKGFEAGIAIVIIATLLDRICRVDEGKP